MSIAQSPNADRRLAGEQQPGVAVGEELAHQTARKTFTSPLTVRPRRTTVGPLSPSPTMGSLASGTSDERSPEVEPASTSTAEPSAIPISTSPGDAGEADVAGDDGVEADVARDGLCVRRAGDRTECGGRPRRSAPDTSPSTRSSSASPLTRLEVRVSGDVALQADVAGDGVDVERSEVSVELGVRRRGLDLDAGTVRDRGPHAQVVGAEDEREGGEREAELPLAAVRDHDPVAVMADLDLFEEALVAVDGDVRLLALGRLDLDVAGGYADLERREAVECGRCCSSISVSHPDQPA